MIFCLFKKIRGQGFIANKCTGSVCSHWIINGMDLHRLFLNLKTKNIIFDGISSGPWFFMLVGFAAKIKLEQLGSHSRCATISCLSHASVYVVILKDMMLGSLFEAHWAGTDYSYRYLHFKLTSVCFLLQFWTLCTLTNSSFAQQSFNFVDSCPSKLLRLFFSIIILLQNCESNMFCNLDIILLMIWHLGIGLFLSPS